MRINKFIFKDFKEDIVNYNYIKTIPFVTFSDLENPQYDIIEESLNILGYDLDQLVIIGEKPSPFGFKVNPINNKDINELLNSCQFSFVLTDKTNEVNYLIKSVLAGIVPICNINHPLVKNLGLKSYSTYLQENNIVDLIRKHIYNWHIIRYRTYWLSWKYHNQIKKWIK